MNLDEELQFARECHADRVDLVEFLYVQRLHERAAHLPEGARLALQKKAHARLQKLCDFALQASKEADEHLKKLALLDDELAAELKEEWNAAAPQDISAKAQCFLQGEGTLKEKSVQAKKRLQEKVQSAKLTSLASAAELLREADFLLQKKMRLDFVEHAHRIANRLELLRLHAEWNKPRAKLTLAKMTSSISEEAGLYNPDALVTRALSELSLSSPEASWAILDWARDYAQLAYLLGDESS